MQLTLMQDKQSGCGRYNSDNTPSAQDFRETSRSVSTPVFMAASSSCFPECLCWRRQPAFINKILGRRIGYRSRNVLCRLSPGPGFMRFYRKAIRVVYRNSEIQVWRRHLRAVRDIEGASEDSGRHRTFANPCRATERASPYWLRYTRCSTVVHQERH
jgi:hypothetical protein